jgi:bifunctional pyridoxal-dependent enzyme with beta-cystathionase and maltose regulon repressor activities
MDHHLRVAFGQERAVLEEAFQRIEKTLKSIA